MLLGALVIALIALSLQVVAPRLTPRANASLGTVLCVGFDGCAADGRSDGGYHQRWGTMFWQMYSGRNCVNYAAFRMVESGMANVRPWSGNGNATNWGVAMRSITDRTPRRGAIAWWHGNAPGASSLGHVAYVERVISPNAILVSESNWDGDFDWREITTSDPSWPSGFIHFSDKLIRNTVRPAVHGGAPEVGRPLRVTGGGWKPRATLRYQWVIGGTTRPRSTATFVPGSSALHRQIWVRVIARAHGYSRTVRVLKLGKAAPGMLTTLGMPALSARPVVGQTLYAADDRFRPAVTGHRFQWYANGVPIAGATTRAFKPGYDQAGKRLTVAVTVSHPGYRTLRRFSAPSTDVLDPLVVQERPASLLGNATRLGRLTIHPGTFAPTKGLTVTYQWLRDGVPIAHATRATYRPTRADVGHVVAVRVDAAAPRYRDLVTTYRTPSRISTASSLRIVHTSTPGAARVAVTVGAPGVARADVVGRLTVQIGGQVHRIALHHGYAALSFTNLTTGRRKLIVTYSGTRFVRGATTTSTMWVKLRTK